MTSQTWVITNATGEWTASNDEGESLGPFPDLTTLGEYLERRVTIQGWQNQVSAELEVLGELQLAHYFKNASGPYAMTYRDTNENCTETAQALAKTHPKGDLA